MSDLFYVILFEILGLYSKTSEIVFCHFDKHYLHSGPSFLTVVFGSSQQNEEGFNSIVIPNGWHKYPSL